MQLTKIFLVWFIIAGLAGLCAAQTPGIGVGVINPWDGSSQFCVEVGETFTAYVMVRPGQTAATCDLPCGVGVAGGDANLAAGLLDLSFDPAMLSLVMSETNPSTAAVDAIVRSARVDQGLVGWALAGDWTVDADPSSELKGPCEMAKLDAEGWVLRLEFEATAEGRSTLHLRRQSDTEPFALSFADICGPQSFTPENGGISDIGDASVEVSSDCSSNVIFRDGFEGGDPNAWSSAVGGQ